jgi:hypothetical protein
VEALAWTGSFVEHYKAQNQSKLAQVAGSSPRLPHHDAHAKARSTRAGKGTKRAGRGGDALSPISVTRLTSHVERSPLRSLVQGYRTGRSLVQGKFPDVRRLNQNSDSEGSQTGDRLEIPEFHLDVLDLAAEICKTGIWQRLRSPYDSYDAGRQSC